MCSNEERKHRMSQLLESRKSFKSFHVFAKQQLDSKETLPENNTTLPPSYITFNKKLIVAVCHKKNAAKVEEDRDEQIIAARKFKKSCAELRKRCKQESATYIQQLHQLAGSLRNLGLNKHIVKDVRKCAATASNHLPILAELETTDTHQPSLGSLGSKKSAQAVPSIFKVELKPLPNKSSVIRNFQEDPTRARNKTAESTHAREQTKESSVPCFLWEESSGKLQQVWCKENYNPQESVESQMLKKNSICSDIETQARTSAGLEVSQKINSSKASLNPEQSLDDTAVQVQIYQPVSEQQFISLDTLITPATSVESTDTKLKTNESLNILKRHIMRCPITDCGITLSIYDYVAHLYRAHDDLKKCILLTGNEACFKMIIYPRNSFQVVIIMLKPVTDTSYDINFPFVPIILMGQHVRDDDIDFFVVWLLGVNNAEYTNFTMEIERGNAIHKRIQSTIFDVREKYTYQEILHSPKALVFNMDEIKEITSNGTMPFFVNVRIV